MKLTLLGPAVAAAVLLGTCPSLAAEAPTETTFYFSGTCIDCSGSVSASLTVQGYTEGQELTDANLVSFTYSGSNLMSGFSLNAAQDDNPESLIGDYLSGTITISPGQYNIDVGKEALLLSVYDFSSSKTGIWNVSGFAYNLDNGINGVWNGASVSSPGTTSAAPEPGTWALMMLGVGAIGAMLDYRKRVVVDHRVKLAVSG